MSAIVYLAGPISGLEYSEAVNWREQAEKLLHPLVVLSPMRYKAYLLSHGRFLASYENSEIKNPLSTDDGITARDRFDVERCGVILMNLLGATEKSIGTMIEAGWSDLTVPRTPLILVMEREGNVHDHGMLKSIADFRVDNLKDGIDIARAILLPHSGLS